MVSDAHEEPSQTVLRRRLRTRELRAVGLAKEKTGSTGRVLTPVSLWNYRGESAVFVLFVCVCALRVCMCVRERKESERDAGVIQLSISPRKQT